MVQRPAEWFRIVAVLSGVLGVALVFALNAVLHAGLPLWLHIPVVALVLGLFSLCAIVTGVGFVEAEARKADH